MKTVLFWFIFISLAYMECVSNKTETLITGRLPDSRNMTLNLVSINNYFPGLGSDSIIAFTKTDSLGNFAIHSTQIESGFYQIINDKYHAFRYDIFLEPGDSIHIQQSAWYEEPYLSISGKGSEKLKYLVDDSKVFPNGKAFDEKLRSNGFKSVFSFKDYIDSIQRVRMNTLQSNRTISEHLKAYFENDIYAKSAELLLYHLERRNYIMKGSFDYYYPDSSYYSFLNNLNLDNAFSQSTAVKEMAADYLTSKVMKAYEKKDEAQYWKEGLSWKFDYIISQPKSIWKDLLALSTIGDYGVEMMQEDFFKTLKRFNNKTDSIFYSTSYYHLFNNRTADYIALSSGMPAPDFALPDSSGNIIHLSDYLGKIVYIDFWGTWCYPCIREIPEAIKLQMKYKDKPVVFLYVGLENSDEDIINWKKFIAAKSKRFAEFLDYKPFPGIHLVAKRQFRNENLRAYKLNFAPTHVLIDQDGNIVAARAKGAKDVSEKIDQLLEGL